MDVFESYIKAIDIDYDSEKFFFTGYVYQLKTPQFKVVKRSVYAKGTTYMKEFVEYYGQNCYFPASGKCFIKFITDFSEKDYTEEFRDFIRSEKY